MTISNHYHPRPTLHRWIGRLAVAGIFAAIFGSLGLLVAAFALGTALMILMIPFLIGLAVPLFLLTSLYPGVAIEEEGLRVIPNGLPSSFVQWEDIIKMTENTLLKPPPPSKMRRPAHEGDMILVKVGKLPFPYRIVSLIAGYGGTPVFAISNQSHQDYKDLRRELKHYIRHHVRNAAES